MVARNTKTSSQRTKYLGVRIEAAPHVLKKREKSKHSTYLILSAEHKLDAHLVKKYLAMAAKHESPQAISLPGLFFLITINAYC